MLILIFFFTLRGRTGVLRILSVKIGLTCLSVASVQEKYKCTFFICYVTDCVVAKNLGCGNDVIATLSVALLFQNFQFHDFF